MAGCFRWMKRKHTKEIKLVIIGLDNAGKTTTIACLQGEPPDGIAPTVGFSNANITMGKWDITIYDLGGGEGVRSVWQKYYAEVYGMIFAIDSGDIDRLGESRNVLNELFKDPRVNGKPIIVFANKQDKENALSEEEISEKLALKELSEKYNFNYNIFSCSAIQGYGKSIDKRIRTGLNWLLNSINQNFATLDEKVVKESAIQLEEEQKEKRERLGRIKKIREERERAAKEAGIAEEESDDESANPFRNINEQVAITEKREKKAKEKNKKIEEHQMKKNGIIILASDDDNTTNDNENEITDNCNDVNKSTDQVNCNGYIDSPRHCIIQVASKENLRDNSPPAINKKNKLVHDNVIDSKSDTIVEDEGTNSVKHRNKKSNHASNYCLSESSVDIKSDKEINDSRAELFMARSSESLDQTEHKDSDCCSSKKSKLNSDFHNVQEVKRESKKKKRKKINRTEPKTSSTSLEDNLSNNRMLPPIRGASKLPPLELDTDS